MFIVFTILPFQKGSKEMGKKVVFIYNTTVDESKSIVGKLTSLLTSTEVRSICILGKIRG